MTLTSNGEPVVQAEHAQPSPCRKVITNTLFNPSHLTVSGSAEASMHLMAASPAATTEPCSHNDRFTSTALTSSEATGPPTFQQQPVPVPPQAGACAAGSVAEPVQLNAQEIEDPHGTTEGTKCAASPPLESEPSHCELRDALTLAVQQRDTAVSEMYAEAQRSTAALTAADMLRCERDAALSEVAALRHELSQCERARHDQERDLKEELVALHAKVAEVEALRTSATNAQLEASSLRKALTAMSLSKTESSALNPLPRSIRISRGVVGTVGRSAQVFGRMHGPVGCSSGGPKWLKGSACSSMTGSQDAVMCAYNCM